MSNYFENLALPPESEHLHSFRSIKLAGHLIKALPPEIRYLENLQTLELTEDKLTTLPPEIGHLQKLQRLVLNKNLLVALPPEIGQLQNLQFLDLSENQLTALPPEIVQLQNLQKLNLHGTPIQDLSPLLNHPNPALQVYCWGVIVPRQYWAHPSQWKAEWLLTESNVEFRRIIIERIGYDRICQELQAIELDSWREYTLLKIAENVDVEPIYLLKMTCPSTGHIHALRVPPDLTSARDAIRWTNWDVDPTAFAAET